MNMYGLTSLMMVPSKSGVLAPRDSVRTEQIMSVSQNLMKVVVGPL